MSNTTDWVLATEDSGYTRHFAAEALPVFIGGGSDNDITLDGVTGAVQIGLLDGVFFVQADKNAANVRVNGERIAGSRKLADGDVIALDSARLECRLSEGRLTLAIHARVTAGDTAPPELGELARAGRPSASEIAIQPVSFSAEASAGDARGGWRPSKGAFALAAAIAVVAVLGWFAFTAKSVRLDIAPTPQEVALPDTLFELRIGNRYLLRSGTHRVEASLPGYYPLDTQVEVGQAPDQSIALTLTKLPGLVSLETQPPGAEVTVDGELLGKTPLEDVEIVPGEHRIEFSAERFLSEVRELEVEGGHARQALAVELTPNWAPVSLRTEPAGAEVLVDGEPVGKTPIEMELTAGTRDVEARLAGYNAWRDEVTVSADRPLELPPVTLVEADGRVALASEPGAAAVSVNGEFRGRTPLTLQLPPGREHEITLSKPGYATARRRLSVEADSGRELDIDLEALYGEVEVASVPEQAEIWVDGRRVGTTPQRLELTALPHTLEVRREGYATQTREITPRPGFSQSLPFELVELDAETGGGYPRTITTSLDQELRLVPAGSFMMGSSRGERGRRASEFLREVQISRAFYLGTREVTNAEFRQFMSEHDSGEFRGQSLNGDEQPVVNVGFDQVAQFLNWLSVEDGLQPVYEDAGDTWAPVRPLRNGYRLPTEAEWAWAARAAGRDTDSSLRFPWGDDMPPPDRSGNYADIAASDLLSPNLVTYNDSFAVSAPPGEFGANAAGIHDMGGNVSEWVQDFWTVDQVQLGESSVDPLGPESGRFHVVRGSSWRSATLSELRLAFRDYSSGPREDLGFRIARNLE